MGHCVLTLIFAHCLNSVLVVKSQQGLYDVTDKWHKYMPFELWCWRRLLRVPWTARRSNQSIQKEISPEYSLEELMLKLKLQYFGHFMRRTDSLEKTPMLGKIEGGKRRGRQDEMVRWHHWLDGYEFEQAPGVGDGQGGLACCSPRVLKETRLSNWTGPIVDLQCCVNFRCYSKLI